MKRKKIFVGGVNNDDATFVMDTKQYLGCLNMRFASSRMGVAGELQNVEGAREIELITTDSSGDPVEWTLPAGTNETIGSIEDAVRQKVIFFNKNSNGDHGIYCYDIVTGYVYKVLLEDDVEDGLDFDSDINSIDIFGQMIYWTDNVSWQKRFNYEAGIKTYQTTYNTTAEPYDISSPIKNSVLTLIRYQPAYVPTIEKQEDTDYVNNFTADGAFQFQYRFIYRDGEESVLSGTSELANYNLEGDDYNSIVVEIPVEQKIEQDVIRVELAVKYLPSGNTYIIKVWDRDVDSESTEIDDHNATTTALSYTFYADIIGTALSQAYYTKQSDAVPITSEGLQIGKNKLFLANNLEGYDTPSSTSMAISEIISSTDLVGRWWKITYYTDGTHTTTADAYYIDITNIDVNAGYYIYTPGGVPPYPASVDYSTEVTFVSFGLSGILAIHGITWTDIINFSYQGADSDITNPPALSSSLGLEVFKSASTVKTGIVFFDAAGRKCGVVTNETLKLVTADRTYDSPAFTTGIGWTLSNAAAADEIPEFAAYYAPVIQKCLRTRFFFQSRVKDLSYIKYDTDGAYTTDGTYDEKHFGLGINLSALTGEGLGYTFQAGDIVKLYDSGGSNIYTLKVKDTFGTYLISDLIDLGALPGTVVALIEVYSPYFASATEPYYEVGQIYSVLDAGLPTRMYSVGLGTFKGDVTVIERTLDATDYQVEAMSPNDLYWQNWNTHHGRANFVTKLGQVRSSVGLAWSNQAIPGTQVNGLSTFDALDATSLPSEMVAIRRLCLVDKIESQGSVMIAVGEKETASIYLGETQITDAEGATFISSTSGTIGSINILNGGYGTINPESFFWWNGKAGWFDAIRGCVVVYASNGLFPVSSYKMFKFFKRIGKLVREQGLKVYGGYDGFHDELLMFLPRTTYIPQNTILSDVEINSYTYSYGSPGTVELTDILPDRVYKIDLIYGIGVTATYEGEEIADGGVFVAGSSKTLTLTGAEYGSIQVTEIMRNFYDPFDGQGGVFVFSTKNDQWIGRRSFRPQRMINAGNELVSFSSGGIFVHDDVDSYNTFYGIAYDSIIAGLHNDDGDDIKIYRAISIEGDKPDIMHFRTEKPNEQSSDLYASEMRTDEGVHRAAIKRDRLSPNVTGTYNEKLFTGDEMRGEFLKFQGVFSAPSGIKRIKFVNIKFDPSYSHTDK